MFKKIFKKRREMLMDTSLEDSLHTSIVAAVAEHSRTESEVEPHRGSVHGHKYYHHDHKQGHNNLVRDYFSSSPTYSEQMFRRRFRMSRELFLRLHDGVVGFDDYFVQAPNAAKKEGLSSLQKVTAAIRMVAYGVSADMMDEYLRIAESTANEALKRFVKAVIAVFGDQYLRSPTPDDIHRILNLHEQRGFPGMLGSIDCMHWSWKNCPSGWKGHYSGHVGDATVILEAVASRDLWIWHSFFGLPGSLNDLNVLDRSPVFSDIVNGRAPPINFTVNGNEYNMGYYLADGIYPQWSTIVKTIAMPSNMKAQNFARAQESCRKDVERAFGVLQSRFHMIKQPCRFFELKLMKNIMKACIIMHNMIVEDERNLYKSLEDGNYYLFDEAQPIELERNYSDFHFNTFIEGRQRLKNKRTHTRLRDDLVEHLWELQGNVGF